MRDPHVVRGVEPPGPLTASQQPDPDPLALPPWWRPARWLDHPYGRVRFVVAGVLLASVPPCAAGAVYGHGAIRALGLFGLLFVSPFAALGALWYGVTGLIEVRARRRRERADPRARKPPWTTEHRFGTGAEVRTSADGVGSIFVALLAGGFAAAVLPGATGRALFVGLALAAFAVLALVRGITVTSTRGVHVTWGADVLPVGAPVTLRLGTLAGGGGVSHVVVVVRAFDERGPRPAHSRWFARTYLVWAQRRELLSDALPTPGSDVELTLEPPAGLPGTRLAAPYPCYYEVELRVRAGGASAGGGLVRRFLLPVYEKLEDSD